jgi:hypothetical protein
MLLFRFPDSEGSMSSVGCVLFTVPDAGISGDSSGCPPLSCVLSGLLSYCRMPPIRLLAPKTTNVALRATNYRLD